jgi:LysM repeat protein
MGIRMYDPEIGLFASADPLGEFFNPYSYGGLNPIRFIDPLGLFTEDFAGEYGTVEMGDNLWDISIKTGIPLNDLISLNSLDNPDLIYPDQRIRLRDAPLFTYESRDGWGARPENASRGLDPSGTWDNITIHNSGSRGYTDPKTIQDLHMDRNKWADIGYHYLVGPDGTVYEGRSLNYVGAHADIRETKGINENVGKIGINVMGDFEPSYVLQPKDLLTGTSQYDIPTASQYRALDALTERLVQLNPTITTLGGHSDYGGGKDCPGALLYWYLPTLRTKAGIGGP